jgi:hypothetical protein
MPMHAVPALPLDAPVTAAPGSIPGVPPAVDLLPLRAVFGQDEANHGTARYLVNGDGLIQVPLEAVAPLTATGGFVFAMITEAPISVGVLKLCHEDGVGCSYAGRQYLGDSNGDVLVPAEAASELAAHGFVPVFEDVMAASAPAKSPSRNRFKKG